MTTPFDMTTPVRNSVPKRVAAADAPMRRQRGITLLVTLIMLVVLTMFAVTGFNVSGVNLKIIGNMQEQKIAEARVQEQIEKVVSFGSLFTTPVDTCMPIDETKPAYPPVGNACNGDEAVLVAKPTCLYSTTATGYSIKVGELSPINNSFEVRASYTDPSSNATATIVQGVSVRMLAGTCN